MDLVASKPDSIDEDIRGLKGKTQGLPSGMETARKAALGDATAILGRQSVPAGGQRPWWDWLDRVSKGAPWRQAASCRVWRGICYRMVIYLNLNTIIEFLLNLSSSIMTV